MVNIENDILMALDLMVEGYGLDLANTIEGFGGPKLSASQLYPTLRALEGQGLVEHWKRYDPELDHTINVYRLTEKGKERVC